MYDAADWDSLVADLYRIQNFMPVEHAHALYEFAQRLPDESTLLEIGAYHGLSTCALAYGCYGTHKHLYTIDTFCGNPRGTNQQDGTSYYWQFRKNLLERGLTDYVTALVGYSAEYYHWDKPLQLLFIDGNHELMAQDLAAFYPHLEQGGILALHDIYTAKDKVLPLSAQILHHNLAWGVK